jgi:hypothetical protein
MEEGKYPSFIPTVFLVNGEYFVYRLRNDGLSIVPCLEKIKEPVLESIYGIAESEKLGMKHYAGFELFPENDQKKYLRDIDLGDGLTRFNLYELPVHIGEKHKIINESIPNWPNIANLILHIAPYEKPFPTSPYTYCELMMDYLALIWRYPKQKLPIVVLISKERSSGKSTFLELLRLMFQTNSKMVSVSDLENSFNFNWGMGNVILVDEAYISSKLQSKIRNESTSRTRTINGKYMHQFEVSNYSKFIMASNELETFAEIDKAENRYFVLEVKPFEKGREVAKFTDLMKEELPQFLDYLQNHHQIQSPEVTRFWFDYEAYRTPALEKITQGSKNVQIANMVEGLLEETVEGIWKDCHNDVLLEFSISGIRNFLGLNKGADSEIKRTLYKLGFHYSTVKDRFHCLFSNTQTHSVRYSCTIGALRPFFEPALVEV